MHRAGQGNGGHSPAARGRFDDGGYIMVVLLIGMAVSAVWMGSMLPSWRQQAVREREADLIFRGEQYARAIALFYRKNQILPPNIDVLVSQRYLRKKYLDPMTGKEFLPVGGISQGMGGGLGGGMQTPMGRAPAAGRGAPARGTPASQGQVGGQQAGIFGVRSTSNESSIRVYNGQQTYSQFAFDYQLAMQKMGAGLGASGAGAPGGRRGGAGGPADEMAPIAPGRGTGGRATAPRGLGIPPARGGGLGQPAQGPLGGRGR